MGQCLTFKVFNADSDRSALAAITAPVRPTPWDRP